MDILFFQNWSALSRTAIVGALAYVSLVTFLRISGKRTLAKMNAFDLVVTVSLGSTLATILLSKDVALAQGALALALLIGLQFIITWSSIRAPWFRKLVTGEPTLLLHDGKCLREAMRRVRVTAEEIRAAARASGLATLGDVAAIVLETDGSFSVIPRSNASTPLRLEGIDLPTPPSSNPAEARDG